MKKKINVAVVGGGIFGCTTAIALARAGFHVSLFERRDDIMTAASAINQYRVHRGYHYPRSAETIDSCRRAAPLFEDEYEDAIIKHLKHYYCIAREDSLVGGAQYLSTLKAHDLPYAIETPEHVNKDAVQLSISVDENIYDPSVIKNVIKARLKEHGVGMYLKRKVSTDDLSDFDFVIVATYAALNEALSGHAEAQRAYQYEVCEKIVVTIPKQLKNVSTVIMDGPFMAFDPLGDTGHAVLGHVEHAIHLRNIGLAAQVPEAIAPLLNKGIVENPPVSNAAKFLEAGALYMPSLKDAKHIGSMFTIRTVLPHVDDTDTRPTIVNMADEKVITIYSGKVGNSVQAARDVLALIKSRIA